MRETETFEYIRRKYPDKEETWRKVTRLVKFDENLEVKSVHDFNMECYISSFDTHVGSASSLIAYHRTGVKFVGFEIDTEMYEVSNARLEREKAQLSLFDLGMERNGDE